MTSGTERTESGEIYILHYFILLIKLIDHLFWQSSNTDAFVCVSIFVY